MKIYFLLLHIILFFVFSLDARLSISSIITFFIHELPVVTPIEQDKFNQKVATPGKIAQKIANSVASLAHKGIFSTYSGYLVISDLNGQITFPRMQQKTDFLFIITEKINPVLMIGNTIHHLELLPTIPTTIFSVTRKQDPQTKLFFWDVQPTSKPKDNIIPLNSIILFSKPKNIIVPSGITLTHDSPQLFLPPVYVLKNSFDVIPALETLKVKQFFGSIRTENKKVNNVYSASQIITTQ